MSGAPEGTQVAGVERADRTLAAALIGLADGLRGALGAERDRWFLWLPAFLGTGVGICFSIDGRGALVARPGAGGARYGGCRGSTPAGAWDRESAGDRRRRSRLRRGRDWDKAVPN